MAFDKMLENRGVQMVLQNLIRAAAPELTNTVQQVATLIENFDKRLARIEKFLTPTESDNGTGIGRTEAPSGSVGEKRGDQP